MTSGQDVSEFLDTLGLVKSYFSSFLEKKKSDFFLWCSAQRIRLGNVHYRDGRDSRFADAGGIAERVAFCRYN
jgi:hypothetical protein